MRYCRKCFDGYYRMFTKKEHADHLKEHRQEYKRLREAGKMMGEPPYPNLTEEQDLARFTTEELAMSEEDRIRSHYNRNRNERVAYERRIDLAIERMVD